jgi:dipeptidyl aminopeptidase/acylaminoacyl peptidase
VVGAAFLAHPCYCERTGATWSDIVLNATGEPVRDEEELRRVQKDEPGQPIVWHFLSPETDPEDQRLLDLSVLYPGGAIASDAMPWERPGHVLVEGDVWPLPTDAVDRSVESFVWSKDSTRLFFGAVDRGHQAIQFVGVEGGGVRIAVTGSETLDDVQFTPDGKTMVFTRQSGTGPVEICKTSSGGKVVPLTHLNDALLADYQLTAYEEFKTNREDGTQIQSFLVKPPDFDAKKKYPVLLQIHGGPQGEWGESWTYRWNAQVFAAAGYVVVLANPRGSIGYGQKFTDDINQDWGGKPYDDLMAVTDGIVKLPYVDVNRMAAAGGSYGGYMVNWLLGHTDRFKCLVSHAGVYDLRAEAEATEELWFPLWEFGGMPWDNPEVYDRWSPSKFVKEFKTPTLVIHGELDFRIPYTQGLQLYTALQMRQVPSKLLIYPDEGHWVLKPQNSRLWYATFLDWINNWTK